MPNPEFARVGKLDSSEVPEWAIPFMAMIADLHERLPTATQAINPDQSNLIKLRSSQLVEAKREIIELEGELDSRNANYRALDAEIVRPVLVKALQRMGISHAEAHAKLLAKEIAGAIND